PHQEARPECVVGYRLPATGYRLPPTGYRLLPDQQNRVDRRQVLDEVLARGHPALAVAGAVVAGAGAGPGAAGLVVEDHVVADLVGQVVGAVAEELVGRLV